MAEEATPRESRKVKNIAALLDVDESVVRRLVDTGELEAHTIGKRGIRIFLDSVADYQARQHRQPTQGKAVAADRRQRRASQTAAHRAAVERLRRMGLIP